MIGQRKEFDDLDHRLTHAAKEIALQVVSSLEDWNKLTITVKYEDDDGEHETVSCVIIKDGSNI